MSGTELYRVQKVTLFANVSDSRGCRLYLLYGEYEVRWLAAFFGLINVNLDNRAAH